MISHKKTTKNVTLYGHDTSDQVKGFVWKCRACSTTFAYRKLFHIESLRPCPVCGEVCDLTPIRHTKGNEQ